MLMRTSANCASNSWYLTCEHAFVTGISQIDLKPVVDTAADVDLSLEDELLQAESVDGHGQNESDNNLLSGWGSTARQQQPIHIPAASVVDSKLQQMSARAANAAAGDEEVLRLALLKCSEHDEKGIVGFCEAMQQVMDVTAGRIDKHVAEMKLIAGQNPADLIEAHSFDHER
jgi:hypothetical protein